MQQRTPVNGMESPPIPLEVSGGGVRGGHGGAGMRVGGGGFVPTISPWYDDWIPQHTLSGTQPSTPSASGSQYTTGSFGCSTTFPQPTSSTQSV